jgi:hypothetical protein
MDHLSAASKGSKHVSRQAERQFACGRPVNQLAHPKRKEYGVENSVRAPDNALRPAVSNGLLMNIIYFIKDVLAKIALTR